MKNEVDTLLTKEMDRKTFLKHVVAGFVLLSGAGAVVKTLASLDSNKRVRVTTGYGASVYGGQHRETPAKAQS